MCPEMIMYRYWYISMKDGTKIFDFELEDEFCVRQQIFMEFGEWTTFTYISSLGDWIRIGE